MSNQAQPGYWRNTRHRCTFFLGDNFSDVYYRQSLQVTSLCCLTVESSRQLAACLGSTHTFKIAKVTIGGLTCISKCELYSMSALGSRNVF